MLSAIFDDVSSPEEVEARTTLALLRGAERLAQTLSLDVDGVRAGRLGAQAAALGRAPAAWTRAVDAFVHLDVARAVAPRAAAHRVGELLDALLAARMTLEGRAPGRPSRRRRDGSFFTPAALAARVVEQALEPLVETEGVEFLRVCDPAAGGGAFLVEVARCIAERRVQKGATLLEATRDAVGQLYGVDRSETAVATTELALWLLVSSSALAPSEVAAHLAWGDALLGDAWRANASPNPKANPNAFHFREAFPEVRERGFDLVIGNPPWVAFAGRSAQPLEPEVRAYFQKRFRASRGFPTLHGLFVERAAELAPRGRVALLLPSALSDLDGYRAARAALTETHAVSEPLVELGQDAFSGVVQPSFVLVADARPPGGARIAEAELARPWRLIERQRQGVELTRASVPRACARLDSLPALPGEAFRELGFQSNRVVSERLLVRGRQPADGRTVPLLEGRNVAEFRQQEPRLYLRAEEDVLLRARTRLRPIEQYRGVDFVVRQTARFTIAARHGGEAFRNSLLAGYAVGELDCDLLVGLLNSTLYRALHVSRQRDARQAAFPQVKIGHLRRLPAPPTAKREAWEEIRKISAKATTLGACDDALRAELDGAVARAFGLAVDEQEELVRYVAGA